MSLYLCYDYLHNINSSQGSNTLCLLPSEKLSMHTLVSAFKLQEEVSLFALNERLTL